MKLKHFSPSSLNTFAAAPAMFVLEKIIGHRFPVGCAAYRGTAVEDGISVGLFDPAASLERCVEVAISTYAKLSRASGDKRREELGATIPAMVEQGLAELRPYGIPTGSQGRVEWQAEGVEIPIMGFYDFAWEDKGIVLDLKTSSALPSAIKIPHARQVALYAGALGDNIDPRLAYMTPKKRATYRLENVRAHREALRQLALRAQAFLALSDDPAFFVSITAPDLDSFYWSSAEARSAAFDVWKI